MEHASDLAVDSVTGVDVTLPVAGPGARAFAFLIDWALRTVLSVAWYVVAALVHNSSWTVVAPIAPDDTWFIFVIAPAAAIYFFYHPVWEVATRGRTPGKSVAGLQTVSRTGGAPGIGPLLTRNVFRLVDSFPVAYALGLLTTMFTRNHVRVGDLAAGTLLVYAREDTPLIHVADGVRSNKQLTAQAAEAVGELLQRWPSLDSDARRRIAITLLEQTPAASMLDPSTIANDEELRVLLESLQLRGGAE